jgi:hypothetical protein
MGQSEQVLQTSFDRHMSSASQPRRKRRISDSPDDDRLEESVQHNPSVSKRRRSTGRQSSDVEYEDEDLYRNRPLKTTNPRRSRRRSTSTRHVKNEDEDVTMFVAPDVEAGEREREAVAEIKEEVKTEDQQLRHYVCLHYGHGCIWA